MGDGIEPWSKWLVPRVRHRVWVVRARLATICPPSLRPAARKLASHLPKPDRAEVFRGIYRGGGWGKGLDTVSGLGSTLDQTAAVRRELPVVLKDVGARSILDAPCGDFFWMKECDLGCIDYIGMDLVPEIVAENAKRFAADGHRFIVGDIVNDDLPRVDAILCRDCLVHLPFADALAALRNFKRSGSEYLLTTTFTDRTSNSDVSTVGDWRPLNLERGPFSLPAPLRLVNECCPVAGYSDKSLGLWLLSSIPD